jgi:superfamily II DNA/RNA helicase
MTITFAELGAPPFVVRALEQRGITTPFEIQAVTIADMLAGRDVLGRAPTGSGKTLAFGVPLVARTERAEPRRPHALILAPTRELADQIVTELRSFSGRLRVDAVYGGVGYGGQLTALKRGVDILVACPGRLEDLIQRRDVDLGAVRCVVLDEADRMADMGFMPAVRRLLDRTPADRQTVLFSATLDGDVAKLTREYQTDPVRHEVGAETPDVRAATHRFWKVARDDRNDLLAEVVKAAWPTIIFCRTRHGADRLAKQLGKLDVQSVPIHGGLSQSQRNRSLDAFASGRAHALIATDVAARGIHVDGVASVVHYDPPEDHKAYIHRSGRTARAGATGVVVSLVQPEQLKDVRKIQRDAGIDEQITTPDVRALPLDGLDAERALAPAVSTPAPEHRPVQRRNDNRGSDNRSSDNRGQRPDRPNRGPGRSERTSFERTDRNDRTERAQRPDRTERARTDAMPARVDRNGRAVPAGRAPKPAGAPSGNRRRYR